MCADAPSSLPPQKPITGATNIASDSLQGLLWHIGLEDAQTRTEVVELASRDLPPGHSTCSLVKTLLDILPRDQSFLTSFDTFDPLVQFLTHSVTLFRRAEE